MTLEKEELISEIETWLAASSGRDYLDRRDIRHLQTLLIDVWDELKDKDEPVSSN